MGRVIGAVRALCGRLDRRRFIIWELVQDADEIPERIGRRRAVLVGVSGGEKWLAFDCPCRDRHRVMLNLDQGRRPWWTVGSDRVLTISPSVDAPNGRGRCHYFIRSGRVQWVKQLRRSQHEQ